MRMCNAKVITIIVLSKPAVRHSTCWQRLHVKKLATPAGLRAKRDCAVASALDLRLASKTAARASPAPVAEQEHVKSSNGAHTRTHMHVLPRTCSIIRCQWRSSLYRFTLEVSFARVAAKVSTPKNA